MTSKIRDVPIKDIRPCPNNPRINDQSVGYVAASIRDFGFRAPIICDSDMVIIAGHTRLKAAKRLGLEKVPVIIASDLTPEQVEAYRIADNSASSRSYWDTDILGDLLEGIDYDMSEYGLRIFRDDAEGREETAPEEIETTGGTMRFTLTQAQIDIVNQALGLATGKGYEYGNMNGNGNKLTEICATFDKEGELNG